MRPTVKSERGMSLVEATIILMVLSLVTAVLAPSIGDYIDDARHVKAKEDVEAIGLGIARLLKDSAGKFLLESGNGSLDTRYEMANKVNMVVGNGNIPFNNADAPAAATNVDNLLPAGVDWDDVLGDGVDSLNDQLVDNSPSYLSPIAAMSTADPAAPANLGAYGLGWRGAYLSGTIGPDPWGNRYACNTAYLGSANNAVTAGEGHRSQGWSFDTFCISAGGDAKIGTDFEDTYASGVGGGIGLTNLASADDVIYVISGYGR